jgi:predicted DNA binding protein
MMLTKIKLSSKDNVVGRLASEMGVRVNVVRCHAIGEAGGISLLRIESEVKTIREDLVDWFNRQEGCDVISAVSLSPGRHLITVRNRCCNLCKALSDSDCFLESGSSTDNGSVIWKVYTPNNSSLKGMIDLLRKDGYKVELSSVKKIISSFELTKVQDEAIRLALSMGYYDIPKRVTLEELAARSGVTKATLNIILRRGQRKILSEHLGN